MLGRWDGRGPSGPWATPSPGRDYALAWSFSGFAGSRGGHEVPVNVCSVRRWFQPCPGRMVRNSVCGRHPAEARWFWSRVGPDSVMSAQEERVGQGCGMREAEAGVTCPQARKTDDGWPHQRPEEKSWGPPLELTLCQMCGLWNCEQVASCCSEPPRLTQAP